MSKYFKLLSLEEHISFVKMQLFPETRSAKLSIDMEIICIPTSIPDPVNIPEASLPVKRLELSSPSEEIPNYPLFCKLLNDFNTYGDDLISEVFDSLVDNRTYNIPVVTTQGVPDPYDAWTTDYKGETAFFFNLSLWDAESLLNAGLRVIKHEITHVLLADLLHEPDPSKPVAVLEHMVIDEGIAHFIGFPGNRDTLLSVHHDKLIIAEKELETAIKKLSNSNLSDQEKEQLLEKAVSGNYWEKYGAICGMFRTAKVYEAQGAEGLTSCIRQGKLTR